MKSALTFHPSDTILKKEPERYKRLRAMPYSHFRESETKIILISQKERSRDGAAPAFFSKTVKAKAENASRGHQRARVRRDQHAHSNTMTRRKGEANVQRPRSLAPKGNSAEKLHAKRTG